MTACQLSYQPYIRLQSQLNLYRRAQSAFNHIYFLLIDYWSSALSNLQLNLRLGGQLEMSEYGRPPTAVHCLAARHGQPGWRVRLPHRWPCSRSLYRSHRVSDKRFRQQQD